ncbi:carboxymuconolactone decarboxylase family protein [Candidatus Babeliales bacterium]|nr:carboxymuconolactone decarboxylase family protein [Candidatus Babeliales bacterium]
MDNTKISSSFMIFKTEAPAYSDAWMKLVQELSQANALDPKTTALAYVSLLAVLNLESGIPFHVVEAKKTGATREEIISAILLGLPLAGNQVIKTLPIALKTFDES